jgi:hypothetical protein
MASPTAAWRKPSFVATLATSEATADLRTLLFSLQLFNAEAPPTVYLYCDTPLTSKVASFKYPGKIYTLAALDLYAGMNRQQMESMPGNLYDTLWFDFMTEKINLLEWVFDSEGDVAKRNGVLFCDADICFFGPLPAVPEGTTLALSPHMIRAADEALYGRFNGGFMWLSDHSHLDIWRQACYGARFFEQSALEDVAAKAVAAAPTALYEFPKQCNYGWWRMWQSEEGYVAAQNEWTMNRRKLPTSSGILVNGEPLVCVHTHFTETTDKATASFNTWVTNWLQRLESAHTPAKRLLGWLRDLKK